MAKFDMKTLIRYSLVGLGAALGIAFLGNVIPEIFTLGQVTLGQALSAGVGAFAGDYVAGMIN